MDLDHDTERKSVGANEIFSCQTQSDNAELNQVEARCTSASRNCLKSECRESNTVGHDIEFFTTGNPSPQDIDNFIQLEP